MNKIIVCSPSTKSFLEGKEYIVVKAPPKSDILDIANSFDNVVAVGGGAVIDTAKIISKTPITCYPTTASGSSDTSHSVYWEGENKKNFKSYSPSRVVIEYDFIKDLPPKLLFETKCDLISHCLDVLWSKDKTSESDFFARVGLEIIRNSDDVYSTILAGSFGGKAIEVTPTTILHALSYPLTGFYNISHGKALSFLIPVVSSLMGTDPPAIKYTESLGDIDWELVASEAFKYDKIKNISKRITEKDIIEAVG